MFDATIAALQAIDRAALRSLCNLLQAIRETGGTVWIAGNGGSFTTALHWATDLSKAAGMRACTLGANGGVLTAWANDTHYDQALALEFRRMSRGGDCLICLSCSGKSPNIGMALRTATDLDCPTVLVTSSLVAGVIADQFIIVPATDYGVIEDAHLAIGHWLTRELQQ